MSEPTYGASFRRDLDCWVVYEGNGEEELCRCGHDKVDVLLTALRRPPARFTREDVEKAAKAIAEHTYAVPDYADASDCREWDDMPDHVRDTYVKAATAALSAIGDVDHG